MARPKRLNQDGNKTMSLTVRFTPEILNAVKAVAGEDKQSPFVREAVVHHLERGAETVDAGGKQLGGGIIVWAFADVDKAQLLTNEVKRLGININQIARGINIIKRDLNGSGEAVTEAINTEASNLQTAYNEMTTVTVRLDQFVLGLEERL